MNFRVTQKNKMFYKSLAFGLFITIFACMSGSETTTEETKMQTELNEINEEIEDSSNSIKNEMLELTNEIDEQLVAIDAKIEKSSDEMQEELKKTELNW